MYSKPKMPFYKGLSLHPFLVLSVNQPGRSAHDAVKQIKNCIQTKAKFVLDADIARVSARSNKSTWLSIILRIIAIKLRIKLHYWD